MLIFSCKKPEVYSETPKITFKSINVTDTSTLLTDIRLVSITFSIIDGDGDIGIQKDENDTVEDGYYDLIIKLFEKQNGVFQEITEFEAENNFRMPYVGEITQGNVLKADINVDIENIFPIKYDTVYYEIYVFDNAKHQSNTIKTSEIILNQ